MVSHEEYEIVQYGTERGIAVLTEVNGQPALWDYFYYVLKNPVTLETVTEEDELGIPVDIVTYSKQKIQRVAIEYITQGTSKVVVNTEGKSYWLVKLPTAFSIGIEQQPDSTALIAEGWSIGGQVWGNLNYKDELVFIPNRARMYLNGNIEDEVKEITHKNWTAKILSYFL